MAVRKYDLYRVEVGVGPKGRRLLGSWQVDDTGDRRTRSLYRIDEEVTAFDARDVEPLVKAAREARDLLWAQGFDADADALCSALAPFEQSEEGS